MEATVSSLKSLKEETSNRLSEVKSTLTFLENDFSVSMVMVHIEANLEVIKLSDIFVYPSFLLSMRYWRTSTEGLTGRW